MANTFTNSTRITLASDVNAVVYTSPAATESVINSIYVDGSGTFTLSLNGTVPFASGISATAGSPIIFDKPINLNASDTVTVTTTSAGLNILISVLQIS